MSITTIQTISRMIESFETKYGHQRDKLLLEIKNKLPELLLKEKMIIKQAFNEGRVSFATENGGSEFDEEEIKTFTTAEDYYNQVFNAATN